MSLTDFTEAAIGDREVLACAQKVVPVRRRRLGLGARHAAGEGRARHARTVVDWSASALTFRAAATSQ